MSLVTFNEILPQARREGRAVAAFNVANLETVLAVFKAAEAEKSPVIIQVYQRLFKDERAGLIAAMVSRLAAESDIPVALHLDHGESLDQIKKAIEIGYTSVMIDGSKLPFADNIALTAEAAKIAHTAGVTLEAVRVEQGDWRGPLVAALFVFVIGTADEVSQNFIPMRTFRWLDLFGNYAGASLGAAAWLAASPHSPRRRPLTQ